MITEQNDTPVEPANRAGRNENSNTGSAAGAGNEDTSKIYFTENSTLQTPEEHELDKNRNLQQDSQVTASREEDIDDDDSLTGSDEVIDAES